MTAKEKGYKKLTAAEKRFNKEIKQEMQKEGILPPNKKPLNRKQFALDVLAVVDCDEFNFYDYLPHIIEGFGCMLPSHHDGKIIGSVTSEQVGALKVLKIAIGIRKFWAEKRAEGIKEVKTIEFYETVIKPICDL